MDRFLERPDRSLTLDEVREGAADFGWKLVRDQYHDVTEGVAKEHPGVEAGLYRVLAFVSESSRVALAVFFDPDAEEIRMMEFEHLRMEDVVLTIPNAGSAVPSSKVVEQILGRWAEGGVDLPENQEGSP
jgi:hypothetical protein